MPLMRGVDQNSSGVCGSRRVKNIARANFDRASRAETGLGVELVSHSVRDTARLLDAVAVQVATLWLRQLADDAIPRRLRATPAPCGSEFWRITREVEQSTMTALRRPSLRAECWRAWGIQLSIRSPMSTDPDTVSRFMALWAVGAAMNVKTFSEMLDREITADDMELMNWVQAEFAQNMSGVDYATALAGVASYRRECLQWWADGFDILVTPTLAETPPKIGEHDNNPDRPMDPMRRAAEWVPFTPPFNTTGQPAISLPLHVAGNGLPVGVQFVADYGRDDLLISLAAQLERAFHGATSKRKTHVCRWVHGLVEHPANINISLAALVSRVAGASPLVAQTNRSVKQQLRSGIVSEIAKAFKLHDFTRCEISHRWLKHAVVECGD